MKDYITLWHTSEASQKKLETEGLQSQYWQACIGGQKKGSYFFTSPLPSAAWIVKHSYSRKELFYTSIPKQDILYPDWRFDLFFDHTILKKVPAYLNELYFDKKDKNGYIPLNLPSQMAVQDMYEWRSYKFHSSPVLLKGIYLKNKKCFVCIEDKKKQICMDLNSNFNSNYLGVVETLVDHLCQKSPIFQQYYNHLLQKRTNKVSTIKYVGDKALIVKKDNRGDFNCLSLALLHNLRQCFNRIAIKTVKILKNTTESFIPKPKLSFLKIRDS